MAQKFAQRFYYLKQWKDVRNAKMASVNGLCEICLTTGKVVAAIEVHHIIPLTKQNITNPKIAYGHDNLLALCKSCHRKQHGLTLTMRDGLYFNDKGEVMTNKQTKVTIVWGCYGSGKTTYVKQNMTHGDLIIDLDMIGQAISLCDKTDVPKNLLYTSLKVRDFIYQLIATRDINTENVWVVAGLPTKTERETLRERLNAELIHMDVTKEECIRRVMADKERKDKDKQVEIIEAWFSKYEIDG
jgi:predicted kinase